LIEKRESLASFLVYFFVASPPLGIRARPRASNRVGRSASPRHHHRVVARARVTIADLIDF
jgi:hypothetical protein